MASAPAVSRDGFSFANGDLFAEAAGHNSHRRASAAELKDHFKSGAANDRPAHWFEAQLIHYGLKPSKTKSVARMRLFDAVNAGPLTVPAHVQKLEGDLKKEWLKKDREAKKALKNSSKTATTTAKGAKRKAEEMDVDVTINVGGVDVKVATKRAKSAAESSAKKAKSAKTPAKKASTPKGSTSSQKPKPATASKAAAKSPASKTKSGTTGSRASAPASSPNAGTSQARQIQTARRSRSFYPHGPGRGGVARASTSQQMPRQTARRGTLAPRHGRRGGGAANPSPPALGGYGEQPPPYSEYAPPVDRTPASWDEDDDDRKDYYGDDYSDDDHDDDSIGGSSLPSLQPLGLLNGRYDLSCEYVEGEWPDQRYGDDFSLVFTLQGSVLWGQFDLGVVSGILRFAERPWESSMEKIDFIWRGREDNGPIFYQGNTSSMRFLGGGRIEGTIDYMNIQFDARRLEGQGTRSEVDVSTMRAEWDGYNQWEYGREARDRWR